MNHDSAELKRWFSLATENKLTDHYALLGLDRFEADIDQIKGCVNERLSYLQDISTGENFTEQAQQLLNEVARAKICLCNPERKVEYDDYLRNPQPNAPPPLPTNEEREVAKITTAVKTTPNRNSKTSSSTASKAGQKAGKKTDKSAGKKSAGKKSTGRSSAAYKRGKKTAKKSSVVPSVLAGIAGIAVAGTIVALMNIGGNDSTTLPGNQVIHATVSRVNIGTGAAAFAPTSENWNQLGAEEMAWELTDADGKAIKGLFVSQNLDGKRTKTLSVNKLESNSVWDLEIYAKVTNAAAQQNFRINSQDVNATQAGSSYRVTRVSATDRGGIDIEATGSVTALNGISLSRSQ